MYAPVAELKGMNGENMFSSEYDGRWLRWAGLRVVEHSPVRVAHSPVTCTMGATLPHAASYDGRP